MELVWPALRKTLKRCSVAKDVVPLTVFGVETTEKTVSKIASHSKLSILERIQKQAELDGHKKPKDRRYIDPAVENFCISSFITGGRKQCEILHSNVHGGIPCPRTIQQRIEKLGMRLREGEINAMAIKNFLLQNNLPSLVAIAEDATAVCGRREYYGNGKAIVGCGLPLSLNGLPDPNSEIVKNAADIANIFEKYDRATVAMVTMIQTMKHKGPCLRLRSYGSNNKFSAEDVMRKLKTIVSKLREVGI